jgi:hypothetical protein
MITHMQRNNNPWGKVLGGNRPRIDAVGELANVCSP